MKKLAACVVLACVWSCSSSPPPDGATLVTTDHGPVQGSLADGVRLWLGIPYAAPPTGANRFLPPKPAAPWSTAITANKPGAECPQLSFASPPALTSNSDEDCLYLNVWAPQADVKKAPVFVWIYGGGFNIGSGGDRMYDGENIVRAVSGGAIVVTFNYRLGALGWISHPDLATEEGVTTSPSQGFLDQQAALAWVNANIAAFGGDPNNVTIAGESAGGISVCTHLAAPKSWPYFQRAVIESGVCFSSALFATPQAANDQGTRLATALGCTTPGSIMSCLRAAPPLQVISALPTREAEFGATGDTFGPVVDGTTIPMIPLDAIKAEKYAKVPTILGTNVNEGDLFMYLWKVDMGAPPSPADVRASLTVLFSAAQVDQIATRYGVDADAPTAFAHIITEGVFACPTRRTARAIAAHSVPTYLYQFTYPYVVPAISGVVMSHSFEIPFVFRNGFLGAPMSDSDLALADQVDGYWFRFASTGDPNDPSAVAWPKYLETTDTSITLDSTITTTAGLDKDACDFWDTITP
jgi:para-nitrobenzyl esterase